MKLKERSRKIVEETSTDHIIREVDEQDFYIVELKADSPIHFEGVIAYFNYSFENSKKDKTYKKKELIKDVKAILRIHGLMQSTILHEVEILIEDNGLLEIRLPNIVLDKEVVECCGSIFKDLYKKYTGKKYIKPISPLKEFLVNENFWDNDSHKNIKQIQDEALGDLYNLKKKEESEIDQLCLKIEEKNAKIKEYNREIDIYNHLVQSYSTFSAKDIGEILASLVCVFEGKNYVYLAEHYFLFVSCPYPDDEAMDFQPNHLKAIIRKESVKEEYTEKELYRLQEQNRALVLSHTSNERSSIVFYQVNEKHELKNNIDYGNFNYLKEFIDGVITYRMSHDLKDISKEQLEALLKQYITSKREKIEERYALKDKKERQKYLTSFLNN